MKHGVFKMKKFALLGAIAISALMVGCTSTETRDCADKGDCKPALCEDAANCNPADCTKEKCPKKAACPSEAKACPTGDKVACGPDCTKPCCAS